MKILWEKCYCFQQWFCSITLVANVENVLHNNCVYLQHCSLEPAWGSCSFRPPTSEKLVQSLFGVFPLTSHGLRNTVFLPNETQHCQPAPVSPSLSFSPSLSLSEGFWTPPCSRAGRLWDPTRPGGSLTCSWSCCSSFTPFGPTL